MKLACFILFAISCSSLLAQEESGSAFVPPQAYPASRYEAGWNKNPFTLKTAPVVAASASFAADLAIAAYYGDAANPTVVVVNTKTGERTRLKKDKPAANGMQLNDITLGGGNRKDVSADVSLGKETAKLQFNDGYLKQMAAAEAPKTPQGQPGHPQPGGAQPRVPLPVVPGQQQPGAPPMGGPGGTHAAGQTPRIVLPGAGAGQSIAQVPGQPPRMAATGQQMRVPSPGVVATGAQAPGYQANPPTVPSRIRVLGAAAPTVPQ